MTYLHCIARYDKGTYLGANCIITLWKASRDDVWCSGDSRVRSLHNVVFVNSVVSFSLDLVSEKEVKFHESVHSRTTNTR